MKSACGGCSLSAKRTADKFSLWLNFSLTADFVEGLVGQGFSFAI
jgi:hypothetical protein